MNIIPLAILFTLTHIESIQETLGRQIHASVYILYLTCWFSPFASKFYDCSKLVRLILITDEFLTKESIAQFPQPQF